VSADPKPVCGHVLKGDPRYICSLEPHVGDEHSMHGMKFTEGLTTAVPSDIGEQLLIGGGEAVAEAIRDAMDEREVEYQKLVADAEEFERTGVRRAAVGEYEVRLPKPDGWVEPDGDDSADDAASPEDPPDVCSDCGAPSCDGGSTEPVVDAEFPEVEEASAVRGVTPSDPAGELAEANAKIEGLTRLVAEKTSIASAMNSSAVAAAAERDIAKWRARRGQGPSGNGWRRRSRQGIEIARLNEALRMRAEDGAEGASVSSIRRKHPPTARVAAERDRRRTRRARKGARGPMRITCRQEKNETGLARVGQGPRGFEISIDGNVVGRIGFARALGPRHAKPWHWYGGDPLLGIPRRNSSAEGVMFSTREEARDAFVGYVKASLALAGKTKGP
jgi:hypothetical protein